MLLPEKKPYSHVRLVVVDDGDLNQRYEVIVTTYAQFDQNAGRRAISGSPNKDAALKIAKEIARSRRAQFESYDKGDRFLILNARVSIRPANCYSA